MKEFKYALLSIALLLYIGYIFVTYVLVREMSVRSKMFLGIVAIIMIVAMLYFTYKIITRAAYKYENIFLLISLSMMVFWQVVFAPFSGTDEWIHFTSAYNVSNYILRTTSTDGSLMMRLCDASMWNSINVRFPSTWTVLADCTWLSVPDEACNLIVTDISYLSAWYRYIPAGIGIALARVLGLGFSGLVYMGRMANSLMYIILGYFVIKKLPIGKTQMILVSMIPMFAEEVNSYSYDAISNILCICTLALCMYYSECDRKLKIWDIIIVLISLAFLIPNKGVYVAYGILLFMIPRKKWRALSDFKTKRKSTKWISVVVFFIGIVAVIKWLWAKLGVYINIIILRKEGTLIEQNDVYTAYTLDYAISHPWNTVKLWVGTFCQNGWSYFERMLGSELGHHELIVKPPYMYIMAILAIIIISLVITKGSRLEKRKYRVWILTSVVTVGLVGLGCMVRFTPQNYQYMEIAGRYFLPIFTCGVIATGSTDCENTNSLKLIYLQYCVMILIICYSLVDLFGRGM